MNTLAIAALVAVSLRFALKLAAPLLAKLGPGAARPVALLVGVAIFLVDRLALGASMPDALLVSLGAPGAVLVNEYAKAIGA